MSQSASPPDAPEPHLLAEPIHALRALLVGKDGTLLTMNARVLKEGSEAPAHCDKTLISVTQRQDDHEAPEWDCTCGYYAVGCDNSILLDARHWQAEVDLWGTVIEHGLGWRAQYHRITAIRAPRTCMLCARTAAMVLTLIEGCLVGWCGDNCSPDDHERVPAPPSLLADPRITWGTIDPAGPPPPTLAAEVAKLTKAIGALGSLGGGVRPIPREVAAMVPAGTTTWVNDLQATNPVYRPQLRIEHHQEGWRMILLAPTGMIMWDTIIPYAAGPDPRFG